MANLDRYKGLIESVREEWNKSETYIKEAEQVNNAVVFPSIKELRYAGRRIVDALYLINTDGDPQAVEDLLRDARFDCHRARHDAIDAATSKIAIDIDMALKYLGPSVVVEAFPKYRELIERLQETRKKIADSRGERNKREEIYDSIEKNDFPELVKLYYDFKSSESLMQRSIAKTNARQTRAYIITAVSFILAIVFAVLAFRRG